MLHHVSEPINGSASFGPPLDVHEVEVGPRRVVGEGDQAVAVNPPEPVSVIRNGDRHPDVRATSGDLDGRGLDPVTGDQESDRVHRHVGDGNERKALRGPVDDRDRIG